MKKTIYILLAASLLLTGCDGGESSSGMSEQSSDVKVTTAAITEEKNGTTEGITSEIVTETNEKPSENSEPETVPTTAEEQQEPATEEAEPTEEAVTAADSGVKVNADGSIDLPIVPVD
jgi:hypothetical protein